MKMKKINILYWIFNGLFAAFMLMSGIQEIICNDDAMKLIVHLGYPVYFIPFLGVAKILGVIAILIPGIPRLKEWAYAGFTFDLIAATYSILKTDGAKPEEAFMLVFFLFLAFAYITYQRRKRALGKA